jgi:arginine decarboxylase
VQYLRFARDFNAAFPGFETDVHGLIEGEKDADGKTVFYVDCVR